ncbi:hypothetical protein OAA20_00110 [bacterium]|nr:hypothetical protein [bacterium]
MAHYAKVLDGKVTQIIVAEADFFDSFVDNTPGAWVQTSYNTHKGEHTLGGTPLRKNFAGVGWNYDGVGFYSPKPYNSWTLNTTTYHWEPPTAHPSDDKRYEWNESTTSWDEVTD